MENTAFLERLQAAKREIGEEVFSYAKEEFWMIERPYRYVEYYAMENQLFNTALALPLARGLHNGIYRKAKVFRNNEVYRLPYVIHCILVCRMLIDSKIPMDDEKKDILFAAALCHDMIEDIDFEQEGRELYTKYHLDREVYEVVKCVSKPKHMTEADHVAYFDRITKNPLGLLVKLSDRGNNVEDLYNMSVRKTHEYVSETRTYFFPMCEYAKKHNPELSTVIEILEDKIRSFSGVAEILVSRYEEMDQSLRETIRKLKEENEQLLLELSDLQRRKMEEKVKRE